MSAFGQPGLNPGYGSKRRQAVLQSQGQLDPYGNQVRQAMQPAQGFAAYSQRPPQQQAPQRQAPQQRVASGGGFGAYAPQPAAQPAPRPAAMGSAQPAPPPSQGTANWSPSQRTQTIQDYWSPGAVAARQKNRQFAQQLGLQQQKDLAASVAARQEQGPARQQAALDQIHMQRVAQLWNWADASQSPGSADQYTRFAHAEMAKRPDLHQGVPILGVDVDRLWLPPDYQRTANQRENSLWSASPTVLSTARPSAVVGLR